MDTDADTSPVETSSDTVRARSCRTYLTWELIVLRLHSLYDASVGLQTTITQLIAIVDHIIVVLFNLQLRCLLQHL